MNLSKLLQIAEKKGVEYVNNLKTYEVGVEVIKNPSKQPEKITWLEYTVRATSESEARQIASELCGNEFGHNPYTTEII
tara:strand:- start:691 stop:927 length:237 start_codon:yes stop_codon:yes gene_type:complete